MSDITYVMPRVGRSDERSILKRSALAGAAGGLAVVLAAAGIVYANRGMFAGSLSGGSATAAAAVAGIGADEANVVAAVARANPAVVSITISKKYADVDQYRRQFGPFMLDVPRGDGQRKIEVGGGSGFIATADGLVITNKHVVDDPNATYTVITSDGKKYGVDVLAKDPFYDIAVLRIRSEREFPYIEFDDSDDIKVGQTVIAIGNALNEFRNSVSIGVVSGLSRSVVAGSYSGQEEQLEKVIQTDAAVNPGSSGGPLLDSSGKVIGVNVAVVLNSENVAFAIPGNVAKKALQSVQSRGVISRPYLGVRTVDVTPELAEAEGLPVDEGALVTRGDQLYEIAVVPGSPAAKAGIREGDVIVAIDGRKIDEANTLPQAIREHGVGDTVSVTLYRAGQRLEAEVALDEAPQNF